MADSSNLSTIQAALVALVSAATGTANVLSGKRLSYDWNRFVAQFREVYDTTEARVHGWTVSYVGDDEVRETSLHNRLTYRFEVRGYYSLREVDTGDTTTSESEFDALIQAIKDQVRTTYSVSGTAEISSPASCRLKDERLFGGVLCHYCEIVLTADEVLVGD